MLDHRDIATLIACVQVGTLGGAARSLKLSISTLSRRIARLEDELGLALLERGRFGVRLTEAGRAIIPHAELALRELEAIRRTGLERGRGEVGRVNLGLRFPPASLPEGPPAWICGDCHVGNLGPVASTAGALAIQVRDLDQTVIGNPAHDLIRLGLSLAMAARGFDLPGVTTAHMLEQMINGHEAAFAPEAQGETLDASGDMPKSVRLVMRRAAGRSWKHLADERIEGVEPSIPLGKRFWPLTPDEREAVEALFAEEGIRGLVTSLRARRNDASVRVMDAAYWRKGCSSLGRLRLAVLVAAGRGKEERHCLVDVKEAISAAAPRSDGAEMPRDNAERVVTGARNLSPFLGARMLAARLLGKAVFVRELLPQDLKLAIEHLTRAEAMSVAEFRPAS